MFSRAVRLVTLYGFEIRVDPSWLLIAALITWSLSAQYFPLTFPGQSETVYLVMAVIAMLGFFGSLLLHEMAHSVVARHYGVGIEAITLFLFGGVAELKDEPPSAGAEIRIAIAGPVMSFALGLSFGILAQAAGTLGTDAAAVRVLGYLSTVNYILATFNLLPAFPLDGGRVMRAWLWQKHGDILKATETAANFGIVLAYMLMGLGLLSLFYGGLVGGLWQLLLGGFLLVAARASYRQQLEKVVFAGLTVGDAMTENPFCVTPDMPLSRVVDEFVLGHRLGFLPVMEDGVLLGRIDSETLARIDRENWPDTRVDDVFIDLNEERLVHPEMRVADLLEQIARTGQRKFLVTRGHRLVGVITLADLTRYLSLAQQFDPRVRAA